MIKLFIMLAFVLLSSNAFAVCYGDCDDSAVNNYNWAQQQQDYSTQENAYPPGYVPMPWDEPSIQNYGE